jgi:hypothetical protein
VRSIRGHRVYGKRTLIGAPAFSQIMEAHGVAVKHRKVKPSWFLIWKIPTSLGRLKSGFPGWFRDRLLVLSRRPVQRAPILATWVECAVDDQGINADPENRSDKRRVFVQVIDEAVRGNIDPVSRHQE